MTTLYKDILPKIQQIAKVNKKNQILQKNKGDQEVLQHHHVVAQAGMH